MRAETSVRQNLLIFIKYAAAIFLTFDLIHIVNLHDSHKRRVFWSTDVGY